MNINNEWSIVAVISGVCAVAYLLRVTTQSMLPAFLLRFIIPKILRRKNSGIEDVHEHLQWVTWLNFKLPGPLAYFATCATCQAFWVSGIVAALSITLFEAWQCVLLWPIYATLGLRMSQAATMPVSAPQPPVISDRVSDAVVQKNIPLKSLGVTKPERGPLAVGKQHSVLKANTDKMSEQAKHFLEYVETFDLKLTPKEGGGMELDASNISESLKEALRFFSSTDPCWFTGCEELRAEYKNAVEAAGGENCTGCAAGDLTRIFLVKVKKAIDADARATA